MIKILKHLKPYILSLIVLVILIFGTVAASLELPDYTAKIINDGIVKQNLDLVYRNGLIMLVISLIGGICTILVGYFASMIATSFSRDLRNKIFNRVENFSLIEFNKFSTASLITRSTNDIQQIQTVMVFALRMILQAPIMGVWAIIKAYNLAPSLSWTIALAVGALLAIIVTMFSIALPKFQILQKLVDKLNLVTRENLTGLRVIRAFNNEKTEETKFDKANIDLTAANLFVNRLMVIMQPMMMLIFNALALLIVWAGSHMIETGSLEVGNMVAFMQYAMQVIMSFLMTSIVFIMIPRASVSAKRVDEVIETEPIIKDPARPISPEKIKNGSVEFDNVTFSYPGADIPVLENISFTAESGETTAIIGSTGSGKSTLISLIPRFYDVSSGTVKIDGNDIRSFRLEDLYSKIGYVPQKGVLFSGTVLSNIKYGAPRANEKQVEDAANVSQAKEFIDKFEGRMLSPIAQGGNNVSGGQKQRLSIARAIARDPKVYIFDDSFSALDFKTDAKLRRELKNETRDKTVIIVAQRISTIMTAEKIIVLDDGKIVGQGRHGQLMKDCEVYREIACSQLSDEELESYQIKAGDEGSLKESRNLPGGAL